MSYSHSRHDWNLYSSKAKYMITNEVPWIQPKYVYCLADSNTHQVFTMKTYLRMEQTETALNELLEKDSGVLSVYDIKDGVLLFEDEEKAKTFSEKIEDETFVVSVDSHGMFRELQDADAVGILFPEDSEVPDPEHLQQELMMLNS